MTGDQYDTISFSVSICHLRQIKRHVHFQIKWIIYGVISIFFVCLLSVSSQGWSLRQIIYHCIIKAILILRCVSDWPLWYCNQWSPLISESLINNFKVCLANQFESINFHQRHKMPPEVTPVVKLKPSVCVRIGIYSSYHLTRNTM